MGDTAIILPGDPLFEMLLNDCTPAETEALELVCGRKGGSGSEVTVARRLSEGENADVVVPASTDEGVSDLLGGASVEATAAAEQTALDWLSRL